MSDNLSAVITPSPDQVWLEVSPEQVKQSWPLQQEYSYDVARWTAYKNRLTLNAFLDWFQAESGLEEQPQVLPSRDDLPSIWELVNGTAIRVGKTRIVLIPEAINTDEYEVQAEWIDIPSWAADYYLAVQVNSKDGWLRIWGYTTHKKLKQVGEYNRIKRSYSLKREELIEDLNVMWVAREFGCDRQAVIQSLPNLSLAQAETLLTQLSQKTSYSPRLDVSFENWGALLTSDEWRQKLYHRRVANELRQWLSNAVEMGQNLLEDVWQQVENIFASPEEIAVRSHKTAERPSTEEIASVIRLVQPNQREQIRRHAARLLGKIGTGNSDVINVLTELLHSSQNENTCWQAALSLGKVDPGNPLAAVKKARLIDLKIQSESQAVALVVAIMPKADGRIGVFLQVQAHPETTLPSNLKLTVLSESGETRLEAEARSDLEGRGQNKSIELRFSPPPGTYFCVRVTHDNVSVTEDFIA